MYSRNSDRAEEGSTNKLDRDAQERLDRALEAEHAKQLGFSQAAFGHFRPYNRYDSGIEAGSPQFSRPKEKAATPEEPTIQQISRDYAGF